MPSEPTREQLLEENARLRARIAELEPAGLADNLRRIASHIPDNIMLVDREHRIQFINYTVPDLTVERVIGTRPYPYVPEEHRARLERCYSAVLETGEPGRIEIDYLAPDGTISKWETRVTALRNEGNIDGIAVISTNVTERDEAAADRDRLFSLSIDLLCVATTSGRYKRVNPAFSHTLGWSEDELLAHDFFAFIHPDDLEATRQAVGGLRAGGTRVDFETRYRCKDGDYKILSWRAVGLPQLGIVYAAGRNVTERRALERQLRQSQKMEAVGQLAGGIAHDFNNLLLAIMMNADLASEAATDEAVRTSINHVKQSARSAAGLTRQLLTFSRRQPIRASRVELNEVVRGIFEMLRRTIPEHIELNLDLAAELRPIRADIGQIEQVLVNLLINARDAVSSGGNISVTTETLTVDAAYRALHRWAKQSQYVLLSVSDDGVGMSAQVRERVFEPFFTTKPQGEGSGLGLATVYGVVQRHDGHVQVDSEPNRGTTFKVYLPVDTTAAPRARPERALLPVHGGDEMILVVEDSDAVRKVVVKVLKASRLPRRNSHQWCRGGGARARAGGRPVAHLDGRGHADHGRCERSARDRTHQSTAQDPLHQRIQRPEGAW